MNTPLHAAPLKLMLWAVWTGLMVSIPVYLLVLVPEGTLTHHNGPWTPLAIGLFLVPLSLSVAIRWIALPRFHSTPLLLPMFIAGMAVSELPIFLGIFLVDGLLPVFTGTAAACMLQYCPLTLPAPGTPEVQDPFPPVRKL